MTANRITDRDGCVTVNIGEYKVGYGIVKLVTWDLDSCIVIILYDGERLLGGWDTLFYLSLSSEFLDYFEVVDLRERIYRLSDLPDHCLLFLSTLASSSSRSEEGSRSKLHH